jgi:hypothetical protein
MPQPVEIVFFNEGTPIGNVIIDATVSETHSLSATLTSHPVEVGTDITDHVKASPRKVSLEGLVSNTPVVFLASLFGQGQDPPVSTAHATFQKIVEQSEIISIQTTLQKYDNMIVTEYNVTRDASKGNALSFTLNAERVRFVESKIVAAREPTPVVKPQSAAKQAQGKQPAKPVAAPKQTSILARVNDAVLGAF